MQLQSMDPLFNKEATNETSQNQLKVHRLSTSIHKTLNCFLFLNSRKMMNEAHSNSLVHIKTSDNKNTQKKDFSKSIYENNNKTGSTR